MNTSLMLLNSTVGETFSTIQQLSFFQESIVHAYRNPILATLLFLNVAVILFAYKKQLTLYLLRDKKLSRRLENKGYPSEDDKYYEVKYWVERTVLWLMIISIMLVASMLFLRFDVAGSFGSAVIG